MKVLMVSWEYPTGGDRRARPPRISNGDGTGRGRPRGRCAQPPPLGHRSQYAPVDRRHRRGRAGGSCRTGPARVRLRLRHDGLDTGHGPFDAARRPGAEDPGFAPGVAPRRRARPRLAGCPPGHRAGRILRRTTGFHHPRHRGRPALRLGLGLDQPPGARRGVLAGPRIRLADHVFGVDERRDHRTVRARPGRDPRHPQRNRRRSVAVRTAVSATEARAAALPGSAGVREGRSRRHRRAAANSAHPPGNHADHRRRWHTASVAGGAGPKTQGAQGQSIRRPGGPRGHGAAAAHRRRCRAAQPLRAVRHRRAGGRGDRHTVGDVECRWAGRSGDQRADRRVVRTTRRRRVWPRRSARCSTIPPPHSAAR